MTDLPIDAVMPGLLDAVQRAGCAVLQAPPGAGKTTRVPLALLEAGLAPGRIVMLEPRRLAARAAAERLAEGLGEAVGQRVGYRMRGEAVPGRGIEVVTEGILTRMLQSDPELPGIGAVIFDEFHERSLQADLGLALALEVRGALRPDLLLLVMSATLDAAPVADLIGDAPVVTAEGRSFPVEPIWLDRPLSKTARREAEVASLIKRALAETTGDVLAFLPGAGEIARVARDLGEISGVALRPLYGALPFTDQRAAIAPCATGRKVVLATSIAETSLTIEGITAVVDGGLARRARFDPGSGMSRLVTERVSRAEAVQRAGRAGRLGPGRAYKLWAKAEDGGMAPFPPAEIEAADLTGLALELAAWGASEESLAFLTPPPAGALAEARSLLEALGALKDGRVTAHGAALARLPLHPRLAHMLLKGGRGAAGLAAVLSDRDPLRGAPVDLELRLKALEGARGYDLHRPGLERIRNEAKRLAKLAPAGGVALEEALACAYPDRIALRRPGEAPRYLLSGGRGAVLPLEDPLAGERLLVVVDLDGAGREARIRLALTIGEAQLRQVFATSIELHMEAIWDSRTKRVQTRVKERLGAIALSDQQWKDAPAEDVAAAMLEGIRELGLRLSAKAQRLQTRIELLRASGTDLPDFSDAGLLADLDTWLLPYIEGVKTADDWARFEAHDALWARLDWAAQQEVNRRAPPAFVTPLGRSVPVDYAEGVPSIEVRLQELFGQRVHPVVAGHPLKITLLSPARRPVQVTMDLPGFWESSYADVRKDMRGRYPRHPWPEDPREADPTLRAKPRGT